MQTLADACERSAQISRQLPTPRPPTSKRELFWCAFGEKAVVSVDCRRWHRGGLRPFPILAPRPILESWGRAEKHVDSMRGHWAQASPMMLMMLASLASIISIIEASGLSAPAGLGLMKGPNEEIPRLGPKGAAKPGPSSMPRSSLTVCPILSFTTTMLTNPTSTVR